MFSIINSKHCTENGKFDFCFDFKFVWCTMSIESKSNQVSTSQFLFMKWCSWHRQFVHIMSKLVISQIQCAYKCSRFMHWRWLLTFSVSFYLARTHYVHSQQQNLFYMHECHGISNIYINSVPSSRLISKLR